MNENEPVKDELAILSAESRVYHVGGREFVQKPLVLKQAHKIFKNVVELLQIISKAQPNLELDSMSPELVTGLLGVSDEAANCIYKTVSLVLDGEKEFLENNMSFAIFSRAVKDFFDLNCVGEIVENFTQAAKELKKKKVP